MNLKYTEELNKRINDIAQRERMINNLTDELTLRDGEIVRLIAVNTDLQKECLKRGQRIADLERLIIRAANVLDHGDWAALDYAQNTELLDELRKATE